jgi:N-acetylglucosaminyl-diphospho-decaprenol L-rhamnosyltransferase
MSLPGAGDGDAIVVSIVIVHYRTPALLERCLSSLSAARLALPHEILIIDNAPLDDAAAAIAQRHGARRLVSEKNLGYGPAANLGMAQARGRAFLILNPDVQVPPGSIEALVAFQDAHAAVGIAGPRLHDPDGGLQYSARTFYTLKVILLRRTFLGRLFPNAGALREHLMLDWDHAEVRDVDWMLGGALLVRRSAYEDVGGMDERFFLYFEDVDWCSRMQRRGWRVTYVPHAVMIHDHQRASAHGFLNRGQRMHLESGLRFWEKWSLVLYLWKRKSTEIRTIATIVSDVLLLSIAFLAAYFTRYLLGVWIPGWSVAKPVFALRVYARFIPFAGLVAIGTFSFLGLYRREVWSRGWREGLQLFKGIAITSLVVLATTFLFTRRPLSRFTILLFFPYALILVALGRAFLRRLVAGVRERRLQLRRLAVFAARPQIAELKRRFEQHGGFGYEPLYLAHDDEAQRPGGETIDPVERRVRYLADERIAEVALFESAADQALVERLLPRLIRTGLPVAYVPATQASLHHTRQVRDFMGFGALDLEGRGLPVRGWVKRGADILLAGAGLAAGLPLHGLQLLTQRPGGLVRETWIGRRGRAFQRRAYAGTGGPVVRLRWLRHYPALLNVLAGEMSFVGILPLTPQEFAAADEDYRRDPPDAPVGILGPAGGFSMAQAPQLATKLACNRNYVEHWSPAEDVRLAFETGRRGRSGKGGAA